MLQNNGRGEQEQLLTAAPASVWAQLQIPEEKQRSRASSRSASATAFAEQRVWSGGPVHAADAKRAAARADPGGMPGTC